MVSSFQLLNFSILRTKARWRRGRVRTWTRSRPVTGAKTPWPLLLDGDPTAVGASKKRRLYHGQNKWSQQGHQMSDVISLKGLMLRKLHRWFFFGDNVVLQGTLSLLAANYRHVGSAGEPHVHPLFVPCFDTCSYGDWSTFTAKKNQSWEWVLRIAVEFWGQIQYPIFTHAHIIPHKHHLPAGTDIQHQQMTITLPIF